MMKRELWRYSRRQVTLHAMYVGYVRVISLIRSHRQLANVLSLSGDEEFRSTILMLKIFEINVDQQFAALAKQLQAVCGYQGSGNQGIESVHGGFAKSQSGKCGKCHEETHFEKANYCWRCGDPLPRVAALTNHRAAAALGIPGVEASLQVDSNAACNASESTCKADLVMLREGQDTVVLPGTGAGRGAAGVDGATKSEHGHLDPRAANPLHGLQGLQEGAAESIGRTVYFAHPQVLGPVRSYSLQIHSGEQGIQQDGGGPGELGGGGGVSAAQSEIIDEEATSLSTRRFSEIAAAPTTAGPAVTAEDVKAQARESIKASLDVERKRLLEIRRSKAAALEARRYQMEENGEFEELTESEKMQARIEHLQVKIAVYVRTM